MDKKNDFRNLNDNHPFHFLDNWSKIKNSCVLIIKSSDVDDNGLENKTGTLDDVDNFCKFF